MLVAWRISSLTTIGLVAAGHYRAAGAALLTTIILGAIAVAQVSR